MEYFHAPKPFVFVTREEQRVTWQRLTLFFGVFSMETTLVFGSTLSTTVLYVLLEPRRRAPNHCDTKQQQQQQQEAYFQSG